MIYRYVVIFAAALCSQSWVCASDVTMTLPNSTQQVKIPQVPVDPRELAGALSEANRFLAALTEGNLTRCYELFGKPTKEQMSKADWMSQSSVILTPLGPRIGAEFEAAIGTESIPNGPPDRYISIALRTQFVRASVIETITLNKSKEMWQVVGYHVQRIEQ